VLARGGATEPHFATKRRINAAAKAAIAEAAVAMVHDGMTVALSAGTTTWQVAQRLRGGGLRDLTFVTNSLNVAGALEANGWHSIVVSGGSFRTPSDALVGPFANQTLRQLNADLLVLGVHSIDARVGLTTPNIAEAETNRVMVAGARRVVVVADSSKLGQVSLATFAADGVWRASSTLTQRPSARRSRRSRRGRAGSGRCSSSGCGGHPSRSPPGALH
jgi:DeoR/GlpR family transcriptional regulator of sugar metabolism